MRRYRRLHKVQANHPHRPNPVLLRRLLTSLYLPPAPKAAAPPAAIPSIALTPQPDHYPGKVSVSQALTVQERRDWVAGLTGAQLSYFKSFPGEQLQEIQRTGQWAQFQAHVIANGKSFAVSAPSTQTTSSAPSVQIVEKLTPSQSTSSHQALPSSIRPPSTAELEKLTVTQLAALPKDQLVNLSKDRQQHLNNYISGKADATKYDAEAKQYKKIENVLSPLEKPAQIVEKVGDVAQIGIIVAETVVSGGAGAAPGIAARKAAPGAIAKAGEYVVEKVVERNIAREVVGTTLKNANSVNSARIGSTAVEEHHLLPRQFKAQFDRAGLDVERFTINLSKAEHRLKPDGLHTGSDNWNANWKEFFQLNPTANRQQILQQLVSMKNKFGIN